MRFRDWRSLLFLLAFVHLPTAASGQCELQATPGMVQPHLSGLALASTRWDPDGAGPAPQLLVLGGQRLLAGDVRETSVMTWDGNAWASLGGTGPTSAFVDALVVWNGQLVAGGSNSSAPHHVMIWDGTAWQPVGAAFASGISNLTVWNGSLVAVTAGTFASFAIHSWDGAAWATLPTPPTLRRVMSIVSYQGLLCVGGANSDYTQGVIERWNGVTWLPSTTASNWITALAVRPSIIVGGADTLYAAGSFSAIGGIAASNIAATSGGSAFAWAALGTGLPTQCLSLAVRNNGAFGEVIASTYGAAGEGAMFRYAASGFGNPTWTTMGSAYLGSIILHAGSYHGTRLSGGSAACVRWDGTTWVDVAAPGLDGELNAVARMGDDVVVGGTFTTDGTTVLNRIAKWDGTALSPLGSGIVGTSVDTVLILANGDLVAGGSFTSAGGTAAANIARWSGGAWSDLGLGINNQVFAAVQMPNGDLIAGGRFMFAGGMFCPRIARWNGTAWSPVGSGISGNVHALAARSDGTLFAGGAFTTAGGVPCSHIAQWDGATWAPLGAGCDGDVLGLAVRPNGDVVAVGDFTTAGGLFVRGCALWNGTAWQSMAALSIDPVAPRAVIALPNGDVVAGRGFHQPTLLDDGISRWDEAGWSGVGTALGAADSGQSVSVRGLALDARGAVIAVGAFSSAGDHVSYRIATLSPTCPASATTYGTGCSSSTGRLVATAATLPWIGTTFRTTTTGVAPGSLCFGITGLTQIAIPLGALLAEGQPGCTLLSALDAIDVLPPGPGGTVTSQFVIANEPSLVGVRFFQQTVPFEFTGGGALAAVRSSNAIEATIGSP